MKASETDQKHFYKELFVASVKWAIFISLELSSDSASPQWVELLSVKDGSFNASLNALASGAGVIEGKLSMMHQFWKIVSYKLRSQLCVSS